MPEIITGTPDVTPSLIDRREAIKRVTVLMGGMALVGGNALLTGCRDEPNTDAPFTPQEIALLEEIADTILPPTSTPGAKSVQTGAFMALMVTDSYSAEDRRIFREGLRKLDSESREMHDADFMTATPAQRLALLQRLDREQKRHSDERRAAGRRKRGLNILPPEESEDAANAALPDQRQESAPGADAGAASAITDSTPAHYFRMMKELALLGYFTSEVGCKQAQRYEETPGRFDPCLPYTAGEKSWAPHA